MTRLGHDLDACTLRIYGYHMSGETSVKTTIYVAAADYRRIKAIARAEGRTAAECVREAVAEYAARHSVATRPASLGAGRSGAGDLASRSEDLLAGLGSDG